MTDSVPDLDSHADIERTDGGATSGTPRWVKVFLIIGLALVLLFVIGKVSGVGGDHGPGRHGGGSDTPSSVVDNEGDHRPPVDHGP
jgi:hypothetical protein